MSGVPFTNMRGLTVQSFVHSQQIILSSSNAIRHTIRHYTELVIRHYL